MGRSLAKRSPYHFLWHTASWCHLSGGIVRGLSSSVLRANLDSALRELKLWSGSSMEVNAHFIGDVSNNSTWTSSAENEKKLGTRKYVQVRSQSKC